MTLKKALKKKGYTVTRFFNECVDHEIIGSYHILVKYCRCEKRIWLDSISDWRWYSIDLSLKQIGVKW